MKSWQPSLLWKFTLRQMKVRPSRSILTLLGIVIGVATIVAVSWTTQATQKTYRSMFESVTGRADLEVVSEGGSSFDLGWVEKLQKTPGVKTAVPVIQNTAALVGKSGAVPALILGIDPTQDRAVRDYPLQSGNFVGEKDGVLLLDDFANVQGFKIGSKVPLLTMTGRHELPVVGLLSPSGVTKFNGGAVVVMSLADAGKLYKMSGKINSVLLVLDNGRTPVELQQRLTESLPSGMKVQPPGERGELAQDTLQSTEQVLESLSAVSFLAGAFVILNAFLMNLGERRRQLAILRSLGATRGQVTRLLIRESLLLGIAGTILGIGCGILLALGLMRVMEAMLNVSLPALQWSYRPFIYALLLGPGMSLVSTWLPARRAGRRAPLEDLLQKGGAHSERLRRWPGIAGILLCCVTVVCVLGLNFGWFPQWSVRFMPLIGTVGWAIGSVLLIPLFLAPVGHLVTRILRPLLGVEGKLAFRQLDRRLSRTALTVGVLLMAVVIAVGYGNSIKASINDLYHWHKSYADADYFILGVMTDSAFSVTPTAIPERFADDLAAMPGAARIDKAYWIPGRVEGRPVLIVATTYDSGRPFPAYLSVNDPEQLRKALKHGDVIAGSPLTQQLKKNVGDEVTLETKLGPKKVRIAAAGNSYAAGGMVLMMEWEVARRLFEIDGIHVLQVAKSKDAPADFDDRLRGYCGDKNLLVNSYTELRGHMDRMIAGVLGFFYVLMALVFIVASLGMVNTLTMNVLEQTREFGLLRAIGMKRRQIRKMILAQALAIGLMSVLPGVLSGVVLSYLINLSAVPVTGNAHPFSVDGPLLVICFAAALVIACGAAWFPARQAARLQVVRALQYE